MVKIWRRMWQEDKGQDLTEYALILVLISLVVIVAVKVVGSTIHNLYSNASSNVVSAST